MKKRSRSKSAYSKADHARALAGDKNLAGAHLEGADLQSEDLRRADLSSARLAKAHLPEAWLSGADLRGADLSEADISEVDFVGANLENANLDSVSADNANFDGANLAGANLRSAGLEGAILVGANLAGANLCKAYLSDANLTGANLRGADLRGARLFDANLDGANLIGANLEDAYLEGTILEPEPVTRPTRSYGRQTGAVLKMGKPDAPSRAAEFKKQFPFEFEKVKGATGGRDFTDATREQVRRTYATPFEWLVTEDVYDQFTQRLCGDENLVLFFNVARADPSFTQRHRDFFKEMFTWSAEAEHLHEMNRRLFTFGWVRICVNDEQRTWLIEEVQSDVNVIAEKIKKGSAPEELAAYADVIRSLKPYLDRFYEDALGVVFMEAEKRGYGVEMLTYEKSKKEMGSPQRLYDDLPRSMGMSIQKKSKALKDAPKSLYYNTRPSEVWFYKPNPRKRR
jgi:uncharacterized protein YjbI with pentapeptide repeats